MASLFKPTRPYPLPTNPEIVEKDGKPHVRLKERGKSVLYPVSENGKQYLKPSAKWAADVRFADGRRKRVRFSPNRDASAVMLADLLKKIENEKAGVVDRFGDHRKRPLSEHLNDWLGSLRANGRDTEYVTLKASRVRAVFEGCKWVFPGDMIADRLETFLADSRANRPILPAIPSKTEWFTVSEVGRLLGDVGAQAVAALVRRHRLSAQGNGRARRFPLETVKSLRELRNHGCSSQTSNHWLQTVRQFARWMVANSRFDRDPFTRLKPMNVNLDLRRRRGELSPNEFHSLLAAASRSVTEVRGLTGADRAMLYRVAVGTGLRASELAALVPSFFSLDASPPVVILPAEYTKNRKGATQPLSAALVADLRVYLGDRPGKTAVWPGNWFEKAADMLRIDLAAAGVPVEIDGPEGIETRDFHALRSVYISNVIRAGADLKQVMTLARHSDPKLTASRYARTRLHDLGSVVDKLPESTVQPPLPTVLRLTGTDAVGTIPEQSGAAEGGSRQLRLRTDEDLPHCSVGTQQSINSLDLQGIGANREHLSVNGEVPSARIERATPGLGNQCSIP
ncbi:integrase-recombinase protein : Marine sediment metagenome DNA, contig: S06H3_L02821 (Fragment) OS=marine sediment metagenome GN=S06H3_17168 PE=4 SV=1: Phage_integrase [Gemmata massiliana]|uniref:Tyr recombinase domain-containing protein n=1 Tax=Gemmata massiliana TaxID=1210884 RepID=A0A6P2D785_9BACT